MKILKNAGTYEILSKTDNIIERIATAARTCYQSKGDNNKDIALVRNLLIRKHMAMIEFADMTVRFNNVCRGFTHEMVRHRLCSYGQESTRYVDESEFKVVVPPHKDENKKCVLLRIQGKTYGITLKEWFELNEQMYRSLREAEWKPEDARQVLPIATKSQIVVKANMREWRHIFHMRCDKFAHWEIRGVMVHLLNYCKKNIPVLFDDFLFYKKIDEHTHWEFFTELPHEKIVKDKIYARNY